MVVVVVVVVVVVLVVVSVWKPATVVGQISDDREVVESEHAMLEEEEVRIRFSDGEEQPHDEQQLIGLRRFVQEQQNRYRPPMKYETIEQRAASGSLFLDVEWLAIPRRFYSVLFHWEKPMV